MENNYQGAVDKARKAVAEITKEVEALDGQLKSTIAQLEKYGTSQIPSKTTDDLKKQASEIEKLNKTVEKLTAAYKKLTDAKKKVTDGTTKEKDAYEQLVAQQKKELKTLRDLLSQNAANTREVERAEKAYAKTTTKINDVNSAIKKLTASQNTSSTATTQLKGKYDQLIDKQKSELVVLKELLATRNVDRQALERAKTAYATTTAKINEIKATVKDLTVVKKENTAAIGKGIAVTKKEESAIVKVKGAYNRLIRAQKLFKESLQNIIVRGRKAGQSQREYNKELKVAQARFDRVTAKVNQAKKAVSNFGNTSMGGLVRSARNLISAFGIIGGATLFASLVKDAFKLIKTLDSMAFSMKAVIKDSRELGQTQAWLRQITEDYGAELVTVTNRYIKFRAAAIQANFSADETQKIFGTMTKAAGVLGLKTDELQGVFLALEQMISKGKITTEELRRQLGERLPGAMDIMADSMGVTTAQLDAMLKKGEVITKDVLPAFADQVEIAFGLDSVARVETLQASTARLQNAWTILVEEFNKGNGTSQRLMGIINSLAKNLGTIVNLLVKGATAFGIFKAATLASALATSMFNGKLKFQIGYYIALKREAWAATVATRGFTVALLTNPVTLFVVALGALWLSFREGKSDILENTEAIIESGKEALNTNEAFNKTTDTVEALYERYKTLNKRVEDNNEATKLSVAEQKEFETIIGKIGLILPGTVRGVDEYTKATILNTQAIEENIKARNLETSKDVLQDIKEQEAALRKLQKAEEDEIANLKNRVIVKVEANDKTIKFAKIQGELMVEVIENGRAVMKNANTEERQIWNDRDARHQLATKNAEELLMANKLLAFETSGAFEEETREIRANIQLKKDQAQAELDEFNATLSIVAKKKAITDAEIEMTKFLNENKISSEEEYAKAVADATGKVTQEHEKTFLELRENIKNAKKDLKDFTGIDPEKDEKTDDSAARKAEAAEKKRIAEKLKADKLELKSAEELSQGKIQIEIETNKAILEDESSSIIERVIASRDLANAQIDAAISERDYKKALAILTIDDADTLNDKLLSLDKEFSAEKIKIERERVKNSTKIIKDQFELRKQELEQARRDRESADFEEIKSLNTALDKKLELLKKEFEDGKISTEVYNDKRLELIREHEEAVTKAKREGAIERIKIAIAEAKANALAMNTDTPEGKEAKAQLLSDIAQLEMDLSDMVTQNNLDNLETEEQSRERFEANKLRVIQDSSKAIADALNLDAENIEALFVDLTNGFDKSAEGILQTIQNVAAVAGDIMASIHDRNIEKLDEEIQANSDYYAEILDNQTLSEEQRSALEAQRDQKEAQLEKKKRKEQTKAAKTKKAFALFDIGLSTAQAILGIWAQFPKFDFGISAGLATIFVSALGAAQIAAVLAQPIPKFEMGTENAPGGWALVDEKRPEVHTDKHDRVKSYGHNKPNLRYMEKGDKIIPSHEEFFKYGEVGDIERVAWNINMGSNGDMITQTQFDGALISEMSGMRADMKTMGKRMERLAKRPINNNVIVEIEDDRAY
jgi:tape measure domain-containing protein